MYYTRAVYKIVNDIGLGQNTKFCSDKHVFHFKKKSFLPLFLSVEPLLKTVIKLSKIGGAWQCIQ